MPDLIKHERSREAQAWLKKEIAEQKVRYRKIEHEMNVTIARQRDKWIEEFLQRIQRPCPGSPRACTTRC